MGNNLQKSQQTEVLADEERPQPEEDSNFTCEICIEPMLANRKFENGSLCVHSFCLDCIARYVDATLEGITSNIKCPGLNCRNLLDPQSCIPIISKPTFEKWCDWLCNSTVSELEKCYCPYRNCSVLILNECKGKLKKENCPNCKRNFCYQCKIPWHSGYTCSETGQLRDRNDVLVGQLIELKRWTRCYKCGHAVERVTGCRDIRCRCGVRFCHQCGGRSHLGPCRHKCCGDWLCFLLILATFAVFCYLLFHIDFPRSKSD